MTGSIATGRCDVHTAGGECDSRSLFSSISEIVLDLFALMILMFSFACYGLETDAENGEEDPVECYHISHVQGEVDWDRVSKLDPDHILWLPDQGVRAFGQLFYPGYSFSGILRANVYKCGDLTGHKHYLSWNIVESERPDFHRPEDFGMMLFVD